MNNRIKRVVGHPLSAYLGIAPMESVSGRCEFFIKVTENLVNPAGVFHGGVIYLLCDVCAYGGLLSLINENTEALNHDIHVSVMRSTRLGDTVVFQSEVIKLGKGNKDHIVRIVGGRFF